MWTRFDGEVLILPNSTRCHLSRTISIRFPSSFRFTFPGTFSGLGGQNSVEMLRRSTDIVSGGKGMICTRLGVLMFWRYSLILHNLMQPRILTKYILNGCQYRTEFKFPNCTLVITNQVGQELQRRTISKLRIYIIQGGLLLDQVKVHTAVHVVSRLICKL